MAKVILAPWGHPERWFLVRYKTEKGVVKSFTSTEAVACQMGGSKVVVLVADTLADLSKAAGHDGIVESAKSKAERYLCGLDAEVRILPGVLRTASASFEGTISDYYYALLREALKVLWEPAGGGRLEVALDLTHGINYMPSLALKAVEEALSIASLRPAVPREGARLDVYNSDPIPTPRADSRDSQQREDPCRRSVDDPCKPAGQCDPPEVALNRVLSRRISTADLLSNLEELLSSSRTEVVRATSRECRGLDPGPPSRAPCPVDEEANQDFDKATEEAKRLLVMLRAGLIPLALHHAAEHGAKLVKQFTQALDCADDLWRKAAKVEGNVVRRCKRYGDGYRLLLYAHYAAQALLEYAKGTPVPLEAAWRLGDAFASPVIQKIQDAERSKIEEVKDKVGGEWIPLRELLKKAGSCEPPTRCDPALVARDLVAHGGWHSDLIELKREGENVYYRVRQHVSCGGKTIGLWEILTQL